MIFNKIHKTKKRRNPSFFCARDRARTCTSLRTLVPETSASTNSATWAFAMQKYNYFSLWQRFFLRRKDFGTNRPLPMKHN